MRVLGPRADESDLFRTTRSSIFLRSIVSVATPIGNRFGKMKKKITDDGRTKYSVLLANIYTRVFRYYTRN